ncbi:MAG: PAS domain S-box protein [Pseudomonadales bacterium]|nr:PAS domain S-box protein [Pseudomonadales bacterium]MCP5182929.1 PAS domain S-box protein [Pseudomonadales bacterium]
MQHRWSGQPISRGVVAGVATSILCVGFTLQTFFSHSDFAIPAFIIALTVSNLATNRGLTLLIACIGSLMLGSSHTAELTALTTADGWRHLSTNFLISFAAIWIATSILLWDPRRKNVSIDALNHALENSPTGLLMVNARGIAINANGNLLQMLGVKADTVVGQPVQMLAAGSLWRVLKSATQSLDAYNALATTCDLTAADGATLHVSLHAHRLMDSSGNPGHYVIQILDLSEAVARERALLNARNRFEKLYQYSNDLILFVDDDGSIRGVNPRVLEVFDQTLDELVGVEVVSLVASDEIFVMEEAIARAHANPGKPQRLSQLHLRNAGDTVIETQIVSLANDTGMSGIVITGREITEQLNSINRLRASEARFSRIFHASPDAILITRNVDGAILDFNAGFTKLLGYTREEAIGNQNLLPRIWEDARQYELISQELEAGGEAAAHAARLINNDGRPLYADISLRYIEVEAEICVLLIARDISEEVKAQEALHESQAKFSQVFTHSPDGIAIIRHSDGIIVDINDAFVRATGYRKSDLVNEPVTALPISGDEHSRTATTDLLRREANHKNIEVVLRSRNGGEIPTLVSATSISLGAERCTLCIARDVSVQRATELRLRESEVRFRGTFENAPIGILLTDNDGRIFEANLFAAELLGYRQDKLPGIHLAELVPPEDRPFLKESLERLHFGQDNTLRSERRMVCLDGTEIWTNFHAVMQREAEIERSYMIVQIADVTETKNSQKRMEKLAFYDTLTNLANRTLFHERLLHAIEHTHRRNTLAALMYLDLDQFKRVNDTLGHEAGDQLLKEVALRLKSCVRKEDTVGRSGGDEFTILLYDIASPGDAGVVAEKVLERLREPINLSGQPLVVTTSIGITILPTDGAAPTELMKNADLAMYRAKERGRNNFQFYSEEMNTNASNRLRMEYEIRTALQNNEFELYYQPKVRLSDQRIVGMECLIRWDHPTRGLIGPYEFIQVAEETGAIVDIGNWVIRAACEAGRIFSEMNGLPIYTAVNISPRQFRDPNLVQTIQRALRQTKLNPNFLELEITETMLMQDIDVALVTLKRLAELGLRFAIDDFGTGYSSLNYLKKFPINTVKVDRSFIMDIPDVQDDMEITAAVIAMAHRLKMEVVAEGVETAEQLRFLQSHSCDYGQGYLFAKPVAFNEFRKLLTTNVTPLRSGTA